MEIVELTKDKYQDWDNFCLESDDAWFWHTSDWLEYELEYNPKNNSESKSFMVFNDNKMIAICPLLLQNYKSGKEFTYSDENGMVPALANSLNKKERDGVTNFVFNEIDRLAEENNVKRSLFTFSPLIKSFIQTGGQKINYLEKFGYIDTSFDTQIIDLKEPIELSYHHSRNIKKSLNLEVIILNKNNITREIFNQYINLHYKAAGRKTRPEITFDLMYEYIQKDNAFLVGAKKENVFIGFAYFNIFKDNVYYSSGCNDPDIKIPISHFIQWNAIGAMKSMNYKFYEIGWQNSFNTLSNFPTEKNINISKFKHGFGGFTMSLFRGEKYYDKNYFLEIYRERIKKYSEFIK